MVRHADTEIIVMKKEMIYTHRFLEAGDTVCHAIPRGQSRGRWSDRRTFIVVSWEGMGETGSAGLGLMV